MLYLILRVTILPLPHFHCHPFSLSLSLSYSLLLSLTLSCSLLLSLTLLLSYSLTLSLSHSLTTHSAQHKHMCHLSPCTLCSCFSNKWFLHSSQRAFAPGLPESVRPSASLELIWNGEQYRCFLREITTGVNARGTHWAHRARGEKSPHAAAEPVTSHYSGALCYGIDGVSRVSTLRGPFSRSSALVCRYGDDWQGLHFRSQLCPVLVSTSGSESRRG